jgi:hypothetical protein
MFTNEIFDEKVHIMKDSSQPNLDEISNIDI